MANSDKNIVITPNINQAAQPNVVFKGQGNVPITLRVLDDSYGTLSFEGSAGQLFSINNNLTSGIIFSVNDVSGIPQIDVNADGTIRIAPFGSSLQIAGLTLGRGSGGIVSNTVLGSQAFASCTTGVNNTAIGQISLANLTTGNNNTGIGSWALGYVSTTSQNTALGAEAGRLNTSGTSLTGVINCIYIGYQSIGTNSASNEIVIGAAGAGKGSNTTVLGNTSTTQTWLYGSAIVLPTTVTIGSQGNDSGVVELYSGTVRLRPSSLGNYIFTLTQRGVDIGAGVGDTVPVLKATRYADGNVGPVAQFVTGSTTHKGLVITGVASQTGNLQEWQNSSGSALLRVTSAGDIVRSGGTADLYIGTDNGYGIVYQADNNGHRFQVWTGSWVDRLVILENGNVGIGTSSPSNLMHIVGNNDNSATYYSQLRIDGTGAYPLNIAGISLNPNDNVQSHIRFLANGTYKAQLRFNQGNLNTNKLSVYSFTTSTDMFTMDCATGYVGIGTYSPTKSLTIAQNGSAPGVLIYKSPDGTLNASQLTAALGSGSSFTNSGTSGGNEYGICALYHNGTTRVQLYAYDVGVGSVINFALDAFSFGTTTSFAQVGVVPKSNTTTGLTVRGFTGQTAALQTFQNSSGEVIDFVAADGYSSLHFGEIDWTPNYSGGVSSPSARTYQKTSGNANTWDGQVYSSQGFIKNVHVTFKPSQNNLYFMMGLNSDPSTDGGYVSLDYAWYCNNDGYMYIYENGGQVGSNYGTYTSSTLLTLAYDGTNVTYYKDGAIMRQVARAVGNALYLDSSFYSLNAAANSVRFGPFAPNVAAQGTANYVAKFNAANSLVNSTIQDDGTTVTITNALVANSVATPRYYSYSVTAGNAVRLGQWNVTEGNVALHIQVSSDTGGNSGTSSYIYQGGFNVISNTPGQYIKLLPVLVGRGHGDGPDSSISSTDAGGWTVFLYTGTTSAAYTMGVAVGIPTGKNNKTLRITVTELRGGMTYTADGSSITYPSVSYPSLYQHSYGPMASYGAVSGTSLYAPTAYTDYWRIRSFYRAAPTTVGNYIEICSINEGSGIYEVYATSEFGAGIGTTSKMYSFSTAYGVWTGHTLTPRDVMRQPGYTSSFDFELELARLGAYDVRLRLRRTVGTSARYVTITVKQSYLNNGEITSLSGTGTSTIGGYGQGFSVAPANYALPVIGGSGTGNNIGFYAGSGEGTGDGGTFYAYAGNGSTAGAGGAVVLSAGLSAGSGYDKGYISIGDTNGFSTKFYNFYRTIPATQGDYVEVCMLSNDSTSSIKYLEIEATVWQHASWYAFKRYVTLVPYASFGLFQPCVISGNEGFELELAPNGTDWPNPFLRVRRTAATGSTANIYINIKTINGRLKAYSGTGTSTLGNNWVGTYQTFMDTVGPGYPATGSGAGRDFTVTAGAAVGTGAGGNLILKGTNASTTGAGGSVILQPGTQATSGGNGDIKVYGGVLKIRNENRTSEFATLTCSSFVSSGTTDLTIGGTGANLYRIYLNTTDNVMFNTSFGTDTGAYPRFTGNGLRLASGSLSFRAGATYQGSDDVGLTWGAVGTMRVSDASSGGGSLAFTSSTASYSANQNDLALTGSAFQRLSAAGGLDRTITGIAPPSGGSHVDGRMMRIYNIGSANSLILAHNSTSSAANNRLWCVGQANITIALGDYAELIYDANDNGRGGAGWRVH